MALPGISKRKAKSRVKDWQNIDLAAKIPDVRHLYQHEEPESSSAGFAAGIAVGVLLGVVLSYLFGRSGRREVVDQFVQRADALKESAADALQQVRDQVGDSAESGVSAVTDAAEDAVDRADDMASDAVDQADDDAIKS